VRRVEPSIFASASIAVELIELVRLVCGEEEGQRTDEQDVWMNVDKSSSQLRVDGDPRGAPTRAFCAFSRGSSSR
jgi:hypothetical protein